MRTYNINDRVRIKYSNDRPYLNGTEGTVVSNPIIQRTSRDPVPCIRQRVMPDLLKPEDTFREFCPKPCQLEPLTDSYNKITWEEMEELWSPEDIKVPVYVHQHETK